MFRPSIVSLFVLLYDYLQIFPHNNPERIKVTVTKFGTHDDLMILKHTYVAIALCPKFADVSYMLIFLDQLYTTSMNQIKRNFAAQYYYQFEQQQNVILALLSVSPPINRNASRFGTLSDFEISM